MGKIGLVEFDEKQQMGMQNRLPRRNGHNKKDFTTQEKHHHEQYYGPDLQEVICPYFGKSLNATNRLFIHMRIQPQKEGWCAETCRRLIPEDTPRDKWAKLVLRMKGNIPEIRLREWKYTPGRKRDINAHKSSGKKQKGEKPQRKRKGGSKPTGTQQSLMTRPNKAKNTFGIILTQPQE